MAGARVGRVILRRPNLRYPFQPDFVRRVEGHSVREVSRRAKYLLVELESGDAILMHLGMSGSFRVERSMRSDVASEAAGVREDAATYYHAVDRLEKHDHVVFELSNGSLV